MRSPVRLYVLAVLLLSLARPVVAQSPITEEFSFPQTHDTKFGSTFFPDPWDWWQDGDGAKGSRTSSQGIATAAAVGFTFLLGPSCIFNMSPVFLDFYVNDQFMGSTQLPSNVLCNNIPGQNGDANPPGSHIIQGTYTANIPARPGNQFEFRFQLKGTVGPIPGGHLLAFYHVNTSESKVVVSGFPGDDDEDPPPPPPPPPDDSHGDIIGQVQQSESNIISNQTSALNAVKDKLGIVDDKVQTVANAVLGLPASTSAGFAALSAQLGVSPISLADAIKGNKDALDNVQQSIAEKILPKLEANGLGIAANGAALERVRDDFINSTLGQGLAIGARIIGFMSPGGILQVADFVRSSIDQVINGNLRPDRVVKRAVAEFNRGLRRLRRIFRVSSNATTPEEQRLADTLADLPGGDDSLAGPDTETEDIFGAYVYFERAYQTLGKGQPSGTSK